MSDPLRSVDNPLVKDLVRLHDAKHRQESGCFLVEGRRAIAGCIDAGWQPRQILVREDLPSPSGWPAIRLMNTRVSERISQASTPSGYVAVFPIPVPGTFDPATGGLILCGLSDPGNMGTLLRCAGAFAIRHLVLIGGCDPWGYKVVQAAAGTLPGLTLHRWSAETEPQQCLGGAPLCGLVVRDGVAPEALPRQRRWLVVGGEAHGLSPEWIAACAERVTLPMPGDAESLNAAVAGAIAAYVLWR